MLRRLHMSAAILLAVGMFAAPAAEAVPVHFNIGSCVSGDCDSYFASGGGSILAELDVINGTDLVITLTNALNSTAFNDDPFLTNLGFQYSGMISGLTFNSFTVLSGVVARPTFVVDSSIRSFTIDFGFGFSDAGRTINRDDRFQAANPDESLQIVLGTSSQINVDDFTLGIAKVGGTGNDARGSAGLLIGRPGDVASVPEPASLLLVGLGMAALGVRRSRKA
jgi:hypothetical protein